MGEHTPGPWRVMWSGRSASGDVRPENRHYSVMATTPEIPGFGRGFDVTIADVLCNGEANARLIAAAPELVVALLELLEACDNSDACQYGTLSTSFVRDRAEPALAKAGVK